MDSNVGSYSALGALNDAINALNLALGKVADQEIPIELWANATTSRNEGSVKRWQVYITQPSMGRVQSPSVMPERCAGTEG
jgi:hypothetical protein